VVYRHSRCPHPVNRSGNVPKAWVVRHTITLEIPPEPVWLVDHSHSPSISLKHTERAFCCVVVVVLSQKVPKGEKHWNPLGPKQKSALKLYDDLREKAGFDAWSVVYHSKNNGASEPLGAEDARRDACAYKDRQLEQPTSRV